MLRMTSISKIPTIPDEERTPLVTTLLEIIQLQREQIQALKDEIAILKGQKPRPKIKPSKLGKILEKKDKNGKKKRPGSTKRGKRNEIEIHHTEIVEAENVPPESRFKGYEDFTVQGLVIKAHNIRYRRERWETPQGDSIVAPLPEEVRALGGHFDCTVVSFILYQHYHAHVTQPLIWEQLQEWSIDIPTGQVSRIITENNERLHVEKDKILRTGLEISKYVHVDDTGARHRGKNGYCTHIGNELFARFQSTDSKSRANFREILRAGHQDYVFNEEVIRYMEFQGLPKIPMKRLAADRCHIFQDYETWSAALDARKIIDQRHIRIATEGALLGSVLKQVSTLSSSSSAMMRGSSIYCCCYTPCAGYTPSGPSASWSVSTTSNA